MRRERPPMTQRILDVAGSIAVELVGHRLDHLRARLDRPGEGGVDVGYVEHDAAARASQGLRALVTHLRELVGHHDHRVADLELGVPDTAVGQPMRIRSMAPKARL